MTTLPEALRLAKALEQGKYLLSVERDATAAELRRLHQHEVALNTWLDKTSWVQETARPSELGMHRADAIRTRMLKTEAQRDDLLEALKLAVRQNEHDMLMTGEELRQCRAAIAKAEGQE